MKKDFIFISESVTEGHPDKLCDQISDAIVDQFLRRDPFSRVITECAISTAIVFLSARFESDATLDFTKIARKMIKQIGYEDSDFNSKTCSIVTSLKELPERENRHIDERKLSSEELEQILIKDQATVFGFACNQTPACMPLPIDLAHQLAKRFAVVRGEKILPYLSPDGKMQVGIEYQDKKPYRIHSITIIGCQNKAGYATKDKQQVRQEIQENIIDVVFQDEPLKPDRNTRILIDISNSSTGGPSVHSGLTGRKNAIDTYGEYSRHSGSALSGKDPTRIDRIGAYAARYAAKNIVSAGLADECEVQLSYSIGLSRPVSIQVETFGTGKIPDEEINRLLKEHFDFRLGGIIQQFNLRFLPSISKGGFYNKLAVYGHVGRLDMGLIPWEETDKLALLQSYLS